MWFHPPPSFRLQIRDNFSRPLPTLYYSLPPTPITISTSGMGDNNNNNNNNDNGIMGDLFDFLEHNIDGYDIWILTIIIIIIGIGILFIILLSTQNLCTR